MMPQGEGIKMAWENLNNNKLRSFLTLLGIAIGIGAMLALIGIGLGFKASMMKQFEDIGTNTVMVFPNIFRENGKKLEPLTERDRKAIMAVCRDDISSLVPYIYLNQCKVNYLNKATVPMITGTSGDFTAVQALKVKYGRFISRADLAVGGRVAVLDWRVSEKLFGKLNPVGKTVKIKGLPFKVIGLLEKKDAGLSLGGGEGMNLYMPVTSLQRIMNFNDYYAFYAIVSDIKKTESVTEKLKGLMAIRYGPKHNFQIFSTKQLLQMILSIMAIITIMLGVIGGIALVVGGIGIMNIMLVTVTERIKEIGVRKAIGAKQRSILWLFLTESTFLCLLGGILGVGIGFLAAEIIGRLSPLKPVITIDLIITAFMFAAGVGLFFGVFPAWKAAKLDPIEALRHE